MPGTPRLLSNRAAPALFLVLLLATVGGCAKYNTYFNAKKSFDAAERVREDALRKNQDPPKPTGTQKTDYESAIAKAQKVLDEYPGHSLSDDALFLRAKAYFRLESYRMSIRQFDLLFTNFPASEYLEESLYLQALNYLLIGAADRSQDYLGQLERGFPESRYQAEVSRASGDNSYTLEDWDTAAAAYRQYLKLGDKARDRDRVALKLAECLWEQAAFTGADSALADMLADVPPGDLKFRAELLRGRVLVRAGAHEQAGEILDGLDQAAAFHKAEGELTLIKAELLVAGGKADEAATLLQGMPAEWLTPVVKARSAEMLASHFLEREQYVEAYEQFKTALTQRRELEDPERSRQLNDQLKDYLAAEEALVDARADRVPGLKLLQANAMLFGFDRPARAAALYREAAADTSVDSLLAARALYGLWITYSRKMDLPDSAAVAATELQTRFPDSAQAREVRAEGGGDLLDYLLAERRRVQEYNLANLSEEDRAALEEIVVTSGTDSGAHPTRGPAARRRMIYLARRDNLEFPPPDIVVPVGNRAGDRDGPTTPDASGATPAAGPDQSTSGAEGDGASRDGQTQSAETDPAVGENPAAEAAPAPPTEPEKPKKKQDPNWDRLREPTPDSRP